MLEKSSFRKRCVILVLLVFVLLLGAAWAQSETVLYSFCAHHNCADGSRPYAGWSWTRRETSMERPTSAGPTTATAARRDVASYSG